MKLIPLSRGLFAKVDDTDYDWLIQWKWSALKSDRVGVFYVVRTNSDNKMLYMHRVILELKPESLGDHRDGDGLNNQRSNLRISDVGKNSKNQRKRKDNSSGFKGVTFSRAAGRWMAQIVADGKYRYLGLHSTARDAALAYNAAALLLHGDFANINEVI